MLDRHYDPSISEAFAEQEMRTVYYLLINLLLYIGFAFYPVNDLIRGFLFLAAFGMTIVFLILLLNVIIDQQLGRKRF